MASSSSSAEPRRVMLWTTPRTLSTVLCKCLSFIPGMRIFYEPYLIAHMTGPECQPPDAKNKYEQKYFDYYSDERITDELNRFANTETNWFSSSICTYDWVKSQLEATTKRGTKAILCKEIAFALNGHYDKLPKGFNHVFLIRNPYKVLVSHKRLCAGIVCKETNLDQVDFHDLPPRGSGGKSCGFQELIDMYAHIENTYNIKPVIIDADDLQNHTSSILRQLCEDVFGVPYSESYLTWEDDNNMSKTWVMAKVFGVNSIGTGSEGAHTKGFTSTSIEPAKKAPSRDSLTPDLLGIIDNVMSIYEKLYELRLKP